jgi:hypothetical protein
LTQLCLLEITIHNQTEARQLCWGKNLTLVRTRNFFTGLDRELNLQNYLIDFGNSQYNQSGYFYIEGKRFNDSLCKIFTNYGSLNGSYHVEFDNCSNLAYPICEKINPLGMFA